MLIQITTENDDTLPTPIVFGAGDQIQMDEGAAINVQGDGIIGSQGANGATMTFLGSVTAYETAILAQTGGHKITIGSTGSVLGTTDAILLDAGANPSGGNIVQNDGSIDTFGTAIKVASSNNQITNSGTIGGDVGIHLGRDDPSKGNLVISSNNTVINTGTISSNISAVVLWGNGSSLENSNNLAADLPVQLRGTASGTISVQNTGTIFSSGETAIQGAEEADWIINSGQIRGAVVLNGGRDLYDGRGGTIINGSVYLGDGDDIAYGGDSGDGLFGEDGNDTLEGGSGSDILDGGAGIDTALFLHPDGAIVDLVLKEAVTGPYKDVISRIENLVGGTGADHFIGDENNNVLEGGEGNDTLNGGAGIDTAVFSGTVGAIVDLTKTDAQETNYGADTLFGIENLIGGSGADHFIGDGQANLFVGGDGNDVLDGGGGIDTAAFSGLTGVTVNLATGQASGHGVDILISIENVTGGWGSDNLTGSSGANWLQGGSGSDLVNGGLGHDTLDGGSGLDVLRFTGSAGATVNLALKAAQNTGYGRDLILGFEALWGGAGADRFTGNSANNAFIGESGRDTISGGSGHDTLAGGLGNDRLTGGSGKDLFVFDTKLSSSSNLDTITDFKRVDDTFRLENAIFKKLAKVGTLSKSFFAVAAKAKDKNDYIVYDKAKGALSYDADGSGKGAAVKFAQITKGTVLGYNDFLII
jgi:serralysin